MDENNVQSVSGGGSDDAEFEDQVQRFMTLNTALRNIASKANVMILAVKAQGEVAICACVSRFLSHKIEIVRCASCMQLCPHVCIQREREHNISIRMNLSLPFSRKYMWNPGLPAQHRAS